MNVIEILDTMLEGVVEEPCISICKYTLIGTQFSLMLYKILKENEGALDHVSVPDPFDPTIDLALNPWYYM